MLSVCSSSTTRCVVVFDIIGLDLSNHDTPIPQLLTDDFAINGYKVRTILITLRIDAENSVYFSRLC